MTYPVPTPVYHITHKANLMTIVAEDSLFSYNACKARGIQWRSIAHQHLRDRRGRRAVPRAPYGVLNDYVPWYFCPRPPMLLPLRDGRVEGYTEGQTPLVHLVSTVQTIQRAGCQWLFTDVHAAMAYADFFDDIAELGRIDWPLMGAWYWASTEDDPNRSSRKQAELLVRDAVPWACVERIGVMDQAVHDQVVNNLVAVGRVPQVEVKNGWYY